MVRSETVALALLGAAIVGSSLAGAIHPWPGLNPVSVPLLLALIPVGHRLISRRLDTGLCWFDLFPLVILAMFVLSVLWAPGSVPWSAYCYWFGICLIGYYVGRLFLRDRQGLNVLAIAAVLTGAVTMVLLSTMDGSGSVLGLNVNFLANLLCGCAFIALATLLLSPRGLAGHVAALACAVPVLFALAHVSARAAVLSAVLMAAWYIISRKTGSRGATLLFGALLGFGLLLAAGPIDWPIGALERAMGGDGDLSFRIPVWRFARETMAGAPVLGLGPGVFPSISPKNLGAHNLFLAIALDAGLVGLLALIGLLVAGVLPALRANAGPEQRRLLGLFGCYFFPLASTSHLELTPFTWIVLGMTFSLLRLPDLRSASRAMAAR